MSNQNKPCWACFARGSLPCISVTGKTLARNHSNRGDAAELFKQLPALTMAQRVELIRAVRSRKRGGPGLTATEVMALAWEINDAHT